MPSKSNNEPWGNYVYRTEEAHKVRNGALRGKEEKTQIYNAARQKWVKAYDWEQDYGGPYKSMEELAAQKRWQSDMRDIYGDKEFSLRFHRHISEALKRELQGRTRSKSSTRKSKRGGARTTRSRR
jgi:hypothetical protein